MPRRSATPPPLYDPSTEHDACGVGFVADSGGRSRDRVLPLALAGLASLGHRGAFGADGASSDGAGVALPLEAALLQRIAARVIGRDRIGPRPAVFQIFLPRPRAARSAARAVVEAALEEVGLSVAAWRTVPSDPTVLGPSARASRPAFAQAFVARPAGATGRPLPDAPFEKRLLLARRRIAGTAAARGIADLTVVSGSSRIIVYKGLVAGDRLGTLFPDLGPGVPVSFATFHQRYATNTHPTWGLAQPFGFIAHNGEINTVRGNRVELRGRHADPDRSGLLAELATRGRLLSPTGSDSMSLDETVDLLVASGWSVGAALAALMPEAAALRTDGHPGAVVLAHRTAGFLAPWDGPAALVFTDGATVGAILDRNGLRPLAYAVTRDGLVAAASETGAVPLAPAEITTLARLGPGEMLVVEPRRGRIRFDAEAKRDLAGTRGSHGPSTSSINDEPSLKGTPIARPGRRPSATSRASTPSGSGSTCGRWPSTAMSPCGAWATTPQRPDSLG